MKFYLLKILNKKMLVLQYRKQISVILKIEDSTSPIVV